ncbi:aldolase/citrate lyase family protein [Phytohalomonas tamaricis]|uniref:aldolase/citrate lyase family protein n=1 Tax=Phytohalomonas tamaricis TaxID=2081032 RepID=UPI0021D406A4|nr:aldolase/citrate lyase family protein [Phytohalomonas tamaricis]
MLIRLLQIESRAGLATEMGYLDRPGAEEVQTAVEDALARIQAHGKAAGILTADLALAERYLELGAPFVAAGSDVELLVKLTTQLANDFKT